VGSFGSFFLSSAMGRFTLADWLGLPTGAVVLLVVLIALLLFAVADRVQRALGHAPAQPPAARLPVRRLAAVALVAAGAVVLLRGQPTPTQRYHLLGPEVARQAAERAPFVHPAEVVALRKDLNLKVEILDLRDEHDFNLFHLGGSRRVELDRLLRPEGARPVLEAPPSTVTLLVGNGERLAFEAWKGLKGLGAANVYVLEGGVNGWLDAYAAPACVAQRQLPPGESREQLSWRFAYATGAQLPAAWPELPSSKHFRVLCESEVAHADPHGGRGITWPSYPYEKRVKLKAKAAVKGGCG